MLIKAVQLCCLAFFVPPCEHEIYPFYIYTDDIASAIISNGRMITI